MYTNITEFYVLILYPATSLTSFILIGFWWSFIEFSTYSILSSANRDHFTSSFPVWVLFISFSYLIALARTSSTVFKQLLFATSICFKIYFIIIQVWRANRSGNDCHWKDILLQFPRGRACHDMQSHTGKHVCASYPLPGLGRRQKEWGENMCRRLYCSFGEKEWVRQIKQA